MVVICRSVVVVKVHRHGSAIVAGVPEFVDHRNELDRPLRVGALVAPHDPGVSECGRAVLWGLIRGSSGI
jgi:hypothetical protein